MPDDTDFGVDYLNELNQFLQDVPDIFGDDFPGEVISQKEKVEENDDLDLDFFGDSNPFEPAPVDSENHKQTGHVEESIEKENREKRTRNKKKTEPEDSTDDPSTLPETINRMVEAIYGPAGVGRDKSGKIEESWSSAIPDIDRDTLEEAIFLKNKKIRTAEDERFLAGIKANELSERTKIFKSILDEAQKQLSELPFPDKARVYAVCEKCSVEVSTPLSFQECCDTLCRIQNLYSELSDVYEAVLPVYSVWKRMRDKLFKAYMAVSSMTSDSTREGEAYLFLSELNDREAELKAIVDRVEIALKKLVSLKETVSRVITAMQWQYNTFGVGNSAMAQIKAELSLDVDQE